MTAYYNEVDPQKAEWLRENIKAGLIAPGEVDERSIADVQIEDVKGFAQCHFFAGIGIWSYALRLAGFPDDRAVWTGSCPCPSFSAAGKGQGFDDARHLWPDWARLIRLGRPARVFGEQVNAAIGHGWLDLVQTDLEAENYAVGKAVLGACSVGAPHIRQRLFFGAYAECGTTERRGLDMGEAPGIAESRAQERQRIRSDVGAGGIAGSGSDTELDAGRTDFTLRQSQRRDADGRDCEACAGTGNFYRNDEDGDYLPCDDCDGTGKRTDANLSGRESVARDDAGSARTRDEAKGRRSVGEFCDSGLDRDTTQRRLSMCGSAPRESGHTARTSEPGSSLHADSERGCSGEAGSQDASDARQPSEIALYASSVGATRGFWRDCDWWYGRDGKWRPIKSGLQPLAHGASARVLRLRGYGDAIVPWAAKEFIEACEESTKR